MAITFPRDLPDTHLQECTITLMDGVKGAPFKQGLAYNLSQVIDPSWNARIESIPLVRADKQKWSAWKKSLRGGLKTFVAYDVERANPLAYPGANAPGDVSAGWDGTATVASLGISGALGLSGLPAAYKARTGDRVGLEQAGHFGYYEILEDMIASDIGAGTLTVAPFLHTTVFTTSAVARLWRPVCQFIIDWQSWREQTVAIPTSISFEAWQRL